MRERNVTLLIGLTFLLSACNSGQEPTLDVSGEWCGSQVQNASDCTVGEALYLTLLQSGDALDGTLCERFPDIDCLTIVNGSVQGVKVEFWITFEESLNDGTEFTVNNKFSLTALNSKQRLSGTVTSNKCFDPEIGDYNPNLQCEFPITLFRIP